MSHPPPATDPIERLVLGLILVWVVIYYLFGERAETIVYAEVALLALLAAVGLHVLRGSRFAVGPALLFPSLFVAFGVSSYFWSLRPERTWSKAETMLLLLALFAVLWSFLDGRGVEYMLWVLCVAGLVLSVYVVFYYGPAGYTGGLVAGTRMGIEINNLNSLAQETGVSAVICFWFALYRGRRAYYAWAVLPIVVTLGTGSRKGLILLLAGIVFLYALALTPGRRTRTLVGLCLFLVGAAILMQLPAFATVAERMGGLLGLLRDSGSDYSAVVRQEMIEVGVEQFTRTPLVGIGMAASGLLTAVQFADDTYLHNNFVELLATLGAVGFLLYYSMFGFILVRLAPRVRSREPTAVIVAVILVVQLALDVGAVSYDSKITWIYLLIGFLAVYSPVPLSTDNVAKIAFQSTEPPSPVPRDVAHS